MAPVIGSWIICGDFDKGKHEYLKKKKKMNLKKCEEEVEEALTKTEQAMNIN